MAYPGFSKLQSDDRDIFEEDVPPLTQPKRRRSRSFTRFELGLIFTLVLFATALATYTVVYIVQNRGSIRPAAVAALSCVALLLLVIAYSIYQRIRRPNWFRDVETGIINEGGIKKWTISAPIPISASESQIETPNNMSEVTLESKAPTYTPLSTTTTMTTTSSSSSKGRLQKQPDQPIEKKTGHLRFAFWLSSSKRRGGDKEYYEHLVSSSARSSSEMSEIVDDQTNNDNNKRPRSLWRSVFELPGEDHSEIMRRPDTPELPAGENHVQIVLTKPEPTARQSLHAQRSSSFDDIAALRQSSILAVDPLRSNPFLFQQLKRDPSVRQTKSSHTLGTVRVSVTPPPPSSSLSGFAVPPLAPKRPRSAEPGPDRARLGYDLATVQQQIDRAAEMAEMELNSRRLRRSQQQPRIIQTRPPPQESGSPSHSRSRSSSRTVQELQNRGRPEQKHHGNDTLSLQQPQPQPQSFNARALRRAKSPAVDHDLDSGGRDLRRVYLDQLGKQTV